MRLGRAPLALAAAILFAACGADEGSKEPDKVIVTQIVVTFRSPAHPKATRSKEEALRIATSYLADLMAGRPIDQLLKFTDFIDKDGTPYNRGRYALSRAVQANTALVDAAFATPVGGIGPKPIEIDVGYVVFRRDE